jgi:hypothetical protein
MYDAFGDESVGSEIVSYGTILFHEAQIDPALAILSEVKRRHRGTTAERLHCRVLFSHHQRAKSAWSALTADEVFSLYSDLMSRLRGLKSRTIVGVAKIKDFPRRLPEGQWTSVDPEFVGPQDWDRGHAFGEKHIATFCARATMLPLSKWPGLDQVRFWPDPDATLIETSAQRRQFTRSLGMFVDNGGGDTPYVNIMHASGRKHELLEVADCVAYVTQRVRGAKYGPTDLKFKSLYKLIDPEVVVFEVGPDGGWIVNVPNASFAFRPPID